MHPDKKDKYTMIKVLDSFRKAKYITFLDRNPKLFVTFFHKIQLTDFW